MKNNINYVFEIVNKEYIKITVPNLFLLKLIAAENEESIESLNNLFNARYEYERNNRGINKEIYLSKNSECFKEIEKLGFIYIDRESLVNASMYAVSEENYRMVRFIRPYLSEEIINYNILNEINSEVVDYILEHSMPIEECYGKEKERIIYDENTDTASKGYIYNSEIVNQKIK